jgi:HAD superfamily hydrolase (TIGR01459 family)
MKAFSERYPVWFCDVWGVVHDGAHAYPDAVEALCRHREAGGTVVLLTNSPRTSSGVAIQLDGLGVDRTSHDAIATSGDVTRELVRQVRGKAVHHVGPSRDLSILDGLEVRRTTPEEAGAVLCTGLADDTCEAPEDYRKAFGSMIKLGLPMICANPDKTIRRGATTVYCAGALADLYAEMGGKVLMAGKPFSPIYALGMTLAARLRGGVPLHRDVLAIGDGPDTDIKGAADFGIDALLIAGGLLHGMTADEAEEAVRRRIPQARIVGCLEHLVWA